jgi:hypothetical protein
MFYYTKKICTQKIIIEKIWKNFSTSFWGNISCEQPKKISELSRVRRPATVQPLQLSA